MTLGPDAYETYSIKAPLASHWRPATCEEVDCPHYLNGWETLLPAGHELLDVARRSGRRYTEESDGQGMVRLIFEPGQACFQTSTHRLQVRPEIYLRRGGNGQLQTSPAQLYDRPDQWVDDVASNTEHWRKVAGHG